MSYITLQIKKKRRNKMKSHLRAIRDAWKERDWAELFCLLVGDPLAWTFDSSDGRVPPATVVLNLAIIYVLVKLLRAYL